MDDHLLSRAAAVIAAWDELHSASANHNDLGMLAGQIRALRRAVADASSREHLYSPVPGWVRLTPQEENILRLSATGRTNVQMADVAGTTEQTIKNHLSSAYAKLGAQSRIQAFIKLGWLKP